MVEYKAIIKRNPNKRFGKHTIVTFDASKLRETNKENYLNYSIKDLVAK